MRLEKHISSRNSLWRVASAPQNQSSLKRKASSPGGLDVGTKKRGLLRVPLCAAPLARTPPGAVSHIEAPTQLAASHCGIITSDHISQRCGLRDVVERGMTSLVLVRDASTISGPLDRLRKLDMVQHCKWIACGTDGLGGRGCTSMRPKLHLPVLGYAFRVTGFMA